MDFWDNITGMEGGMLQELPIYPSLLQDEEKAVEVLESLREPLSLRDAARCLGKALQDCSVELFRRLLEHSQDGECTEQCSCFGETFRSGVYGHGSLLMLAAMLDKPEQARLLLGRGYDCNGGGLAVASYVRQDGKAWGDTVPLYAQFCGSAGCFLRLDNDVINCATPLAAALLCGSLQTAEVLLRQTGIWKGESSAVCRAAVMVLEGMTRETLPRERQQDQLEIIRQIFCPEQECLPDRDTLLRSVYLQPASFVDICSVRTLRCQLESGLCDEEDARRIVEILGRDRIWWRSGDYDRSRAGKLLALKRHFPDLCREGWVTGVFLREVVRRIQNNLPHQMLLDAWKQLCGKERDLTWGNGLITALNWRDLQRFLKEAGEDGELVMDADAMNQWYGFRYRSVVSLLKRVRFRCRDGEGVNSLLQYLLQTGDLRVLRMAAKQGLLDHEDPKGLLKCIIEDSVRHQDARAVVLTYAKNQPREAGQTANWQEPRRWDHWCLCENLQEETAQEVLRSLLYEKLSRKECLRQMFRIQQYLSCGIFTPGMKVEHPRFPSLETDSLVGMACCAENGQMMELLLEHMPHMLRERVQASWGEQFFFRGTPLALAAALGRTEQVQLLLKSGVHPDEVGRGDVSRFFRRSMSFTEDGFPVTPLLAAILFGQEETARLLLEHGAVCDFSRPTHREILYQGSAATLKLAETLESVGFESLSEPTLENLRFTTAESGARGVFWRCIDARSRQI